MVAPALAAVVDWTFACLPSDSNQGPLELRSRRRDHVYADHLGDGGPWNRLRDRRAVARATASGHLILRTPPPGRSSLETGRCLPRRRVA